MNRSITAMLLMMALWSSCSKETVNPDAPTGDGVIRINSVIEDAVQSRGVAVGNMALEDMRFLHDDSSADDYYDGDFSGKSPFSGSRAADGKITFDVPQMYSTRGNFDGPARYDYITGWWPAGTFDETARTVRWEVDGKTDILMTPQAFNVGTYVNPHTGPMTLRHVLAQLEVTCVADKNYSEAVVQASWGKITKIEILASETLLSAELTLIANSGYDFTSPGNIALWQADYNTPFPDTGVTLLHTPNPGVTAAGMFAPTLGSGTLLVPIQLKVYTEKFPLGIEIAVQLKDGDRNEIFEMCKCHQVTLTFGPADQPIKVLSTGIEAWKTGYTANDTPMESPKPVILSYGVAPYDIVSGMIYNNLITLTGSTPQSYNSYSYYAGSAAYNGGYVAHKLDDRSATVNKQSPYWKFEIAQENSAAEPTWQAAWNACKAKAPAGEWRLPRLSELVLMFLNRTALGLKEFDDGYPRLFWSGTEMDATNSYYVSPEENYYGIATKTDNTEMFARCVREIPQARIILELGKAPYNVTKGTFNTGNSSSPNNVDISMTTPTSTSYNGYTYNAADANNNGGYKTGLATTVADQPPYKKLEIALEDEPGTAGNFVWAYAACKNKTTDRGGWRIPRMSELLLMALNRAKLEKVVGFTPFRSALYWSGTEFTSGDNGNAYFTTMGTTQAAATSKINVGYVRCVREVP